MYRHGDVLIKKASEIKGRKLNHLVIAEGETTGNKHEVKGDAELYEYEGTFYLSAKATVEITHPEHKTIELPKGDYEITFQKEYTVDDNKYRRVTD